MDKNVVIIGAAGRMGGALVRCLSRNAVEGLKLSGAVDLARAAIQGQDIGVASGAGETGVLLSSDLPAMQEHGDVFIDFSFHTGVNERAELLAGWGKGWVIGTTGLTDKENASIQAAAEKIPIVMAPNMSLGINLLSSLVEQAARALSDRGYDIEVIEHHHRKKLDAPSGTALFLGEAAAKGAGWNLDEVSEHGREGISPSERPQKQIGFHAIRGGDIIGDHRVLLSAEGEMVEIAHRATSRDTFALGALRAADWVVGKPAGLYSMRDVLGLAD